MTARIELESDILAKRLCLKPEQVKSWMKHENVETICGLKAKWPDLDHAQAMRRAHDEIIASAFAEI